MTSPPRPEVSGAWLESWAARRSARVRGINPWLLVVRVGRASAADRVPGLAAEMAFFAIISLIPLFVTLGAGLGFLATILGRTAVEEIEVFVVSGIGAIFSPDTTREVVAPLVRALLTEQRTGLALSSLLVALWLASRVFTVTIRALDLAYNVPTPHRAIHLRLRAVAFAAVAVFVVPLTLAFVVIGPLLGGGRALAARVGMGDAFAFLWAIGRWPLLFLVLVAFLTWLYTAGPNLTTSLRSSLPGALAGVVLWILVSVVVRLYLDTNPDQTRVTAEEEAVALVGQAVGAVVAAILWIYASSATLLVGGEVNAELAKLRDELPPESRPRRRGDGG